jgi:hypothetical protein
MKTTVGSLPSSVYWRRRALVAGGVLALVLLGTYTCSGQSEGSKQKNSAQGGKGVQSPGLSPSVQATRPIVLTPSPGEASNGAPPFGSGGGNGTGAGNDAGTKTGTGTGSNTGTGDGSCTDAELSVTLAADPAPVRFGEPSRLILRIRNVSSHTCMRDVGPQMQELYIQADKSTVWSSDKCDGKNGQNIITFEPNRLEEYSFNWDGNATDAGCTNRKAVPKGTYNLYGRVGTKTSAPAVLTIA